jgi:hypothetical protein
MHASFDILHAGVDILTVACAVVSTYLASRRAMLDRISKLEIDLAKLQGACKASGIDL